MTSTHHDPPAVAADGVRPGAGLLSGLLLLRFVAILLGVAATYGVVRLFGDSATPWATATTWSAISLVLIADVATIVALVVVLRREGRRLRDLLGPCDALGTAWRAVVATVVMFVAFELGGYLPGLLTGPPVSSGAFSHIPVWFGLWNLLVLPVTVAVTEEFLYRGYLQPRLAARIGTPAAVVVVAAAFALQHVGLALTSGPTLAAKLGATFLAGIVLGLLRLRSRRLLPLMIAHWANDVWGLGLPMLAYALFA